MFITTGFFIASNSSSVATCANPAAQTRDDLKMDSARHHTVFPVRDYDLNATLNSGQAFRWQLRQGAWEGVVGSRWVRLEQQGDAIAAETAAPQGEWHWLAEYLQTGVSLAEVLTTFPNDPAMQEAVRACRGLRLLRQDPWECLASFILSSNKRIRHIQQIIAVLCARMGEPVAVPPGHPPEFSFPNAARIAAGSPAALRACKMGFRADYLFDTSRTIATAIMNPAGLRDLPLAEARTRLMRLPGVGRKIADCVLLMSCGFAGAFPVDVWIARVLREFYFPGQKIPAARLIRFTESYFGPQAGYAQQYLFHYIRTRKPNALRRENG